MWIFTLLFLGPIIYMIVSIATDSIKENLNKAKHKKFYGEEELLFASTYQNDKITNSDIMELFFSQVNFYKKHNYIIRYKVFTEKDNQNYAWSIRTINETFGWGIVYNIQFQFSNGYIYLSFSDREFRTGSQLSKEYYILGYDLGSYDLKRVLDTCRDESRIAWKKHGKESNSELPFNYYSLDDENHKRQNTSSKLNNYTDDLLSFYRSLLGLKLRFSQIELKKAYREAVGKYHPDKYSTSSLRDCKNAEILMKQVNEAFKALKEIAK